MVLPPLPLLSGLPRGRPLAAAGERAGRGDVCGCVWPQAPPAEGSRGSRGGGHRPPVRSGAWSRRRGRPTPADSHPPRLRRDTVERCVARGSGGLPVGLELPVGLLGDTASAGKVGRAAALRGGAGPGAAGSPPEACSPLVRACGAAGDPHRAPLAGSLRVWGSVGFLLSLFFLL